jgi:hypothetical protein
VQAARHPASGIRHRKGAVGQTGSVAVCERFIRTLKDGCTRARAFVPLVQRALRRELSLFFDWFNRDRPHMTLGGDTPEEVYFGRRSACRACFEPRPNWPRDSPCAKPQTLVKGQPGVVLDLKVGFVSGRRHLPRVTLRRAALIVKDQLFSALPLRAFGRTTAFHRSTTTNFAEKPLNKRSHQWRWTSTPISTLDSE